MYIYSGTCRQGVCGEATPLKDIEGKDLFVGDIVLTSTIDEFGICYNNGLTAVVSDRFTSYSNGTHTEKEDAVEYFVMGIKGIDFMDKDRERWMVKKMKSFEYVIEGEKWETAGFNYSSI